MTSWIKGGSVGWALELRWSTELAISEQQFNPQHVDSPLSPRHWADMASVTGQWGAIRHSNLGDPGVGLSLFTRSALQGGRPVRKLEPPVLRAHASTRGCWEKRWRSLTEKEPRPGPLTTPAVIRGVQKRSRAFEHQAPLRGVISWSQII